MRPHVISKYSLSFCKRKGGDDSERCFYFHDLQSFIDGNAQEYIWEPLTDEEFYKCYKIILEYLKEHNVEMYQDLESDNGIYSFCLQEECEAMSDGSPIHVRSFEDARTEVTALADELFHDNKDDYDYNDSYDGIIGDNDYDYDIDEDDWETEWDNYLNDAMDDFDGGYGW